MNKQEIFNRVMRHLRKQGKRSVNKAGMCLYRGPNGTRCAIGALIPNELYDERFEGNSANIPEIVFAAGLPHSHTFAKDIQKIHDLARDDHFLEDIEMRAAIVAKRHNLKVPGA